MTFLNHLHIPTKMGIPAATAILGMLAIALLGGSAITEQSRLLDTLFNRSFTREADVQALTDTLTVAHAGLYRTVILSTANASPKAVEDESKALTEQITKLKTQADKMKGQSAATEEEGQILQRFGSDTAAYQAKVTSFLDLLKMGVDPLDFLQEVQAAYGRLNGTARDYLTYQRQQSADAYANVNASVDATTQAFIASAIVALLITVGVALFIGFNIARPVVRLTTVMERLAQGRLEDEVPAAERGDEIGQMARTVRVFKENALRVQEMAREQEAMRARATEEQRRAMNSLAADLEASVKAMMGEVVRSATSMRGEANVMLENARQTSHHSDSVAHAVQEATSEVESVAAGAEQLRASIDEITRSITQSTQLARGAVDEAGRTDSIVQGLSEASRKIEEVVGLINNIAGQTNLLALNATIEAARAGEAGKGFAVVAQEVKSLANQTAKATDEIGAEIAAVQAATTAAVNAIRAIVNTIRQVDESLSTVAAAVEEQDAATRDISERSQRAATDTVAVLQEMRLVQQAAETTGHSAGAVQTTTEELSRSFNRLDNEIEAFITRITAA
ncbi:methyl-accepting chemotaxis protein [Azospirillum brasilense]|uniref:Methyl-accepting chemotaxis protein n=3 Tax=Azospirillum TaxID=191 RepID=A0A0P0EK73_AZOBR|nr:methyl-accepting chemotaxis protein [Azospirillum brasilense]ALJ34320.1 chemotaxis protein [Azospirillum brasilense]MDW7556438.1 methyl-accepting chemotaxis protein [Azospirillum brasilense]MDW7596150.1 methyl-accepting chemotaxis protein [Azospirillum brasilense]MDW7631201.1 methyl-accepting chemotaxis protein [Azospirillum brasilense]MDX5952928.1 methyl-accepting chemotaxis protein [Azospirillum brasilense]